MESSDADETPQNLELTTENASSYSQSALQAILSATKASNDLPAAGDDFDYYSTFQGFRALMLKEGKSILSLMTSLMQSQGIREKFEGRELEDKFDLLIDVNDTIFENVSNYLDEAAGLKKSEEDLLVATRTNPINTSWNKKYAIGVRSPQSCTLLAAKNITRPQLSFKEKVDNTNTLFAPIIKEKPNSIKPLAIIVEKDGLVEQFCHPYECEIEKFSPGNNHLQSVQPIVPKPVEETPLIFVKEKDKLLSLCNELKKQKEIAVDLEHHSYRSFQGFTCLMQISTRDKDYIIDVLELRSEMHILNEVFTDPKIVKVLHGADMDVLWLQRDFGLYLVNLFDTGQAARVLHFAHLSLAFLLKHYCKIDVDKKFQLADWRIRPLPAEMVKYAREDTHFLLYVYDSLKNDLLNDGNEMKNLLLSTFERSKEICLKRYEKPLFTEDKYIELCRKTHKKFNPRQLYCLKGLFSWRDGIARSYDESTGYVLPNHMMLQIAEALPREQQGILACCNPIPPFVRQQLNELHSIICKATEVSLKQLETPEFQQKIEAHLYNKIDLNNVLYCPHDMHHLEEGNAQLSNHLTLKTQDNPSSSLMLKKKPLLRSFMKLNGVKKKTSSKEDPFQKVAEIIKKCTSPFQRFKITKQFNKDKKESQIEKPEEHKIEESNEANSAERYTNLDISVEVINTSVEVINTSVEIIDTTPVPSSSTAKQDETDEEIDPTPLSKRKSKKKRKRAKLEPDISIVDVITPECKKLKTPEVIEVEDEEDNFKPYDYSQPDLSAFSNKQTPRGRFERGRNNQSQHQGPSWKKNKKQSKQSTFSSKPWQNSGGAKNWPQKK